MGYITADQALAESGRVFEDIEVPELGGTLRIGQLSASRVFEFRDLQTRAADKGELGMMRKQAEVVLLGGCVDESGGPLFNQKQVRDLVERLPMNVTNRIMKAIFELTVPDAERPGNA